MAEKSAVAVHQSRHQRGIRRGAGNVAADDAGGVVDIHGFVAVFLHHAFQTAGDRIKGFIPADTLKLAFTALADALHWVVKTVGMVDSAANRAAT
ncbi:hypothetical protein D3C72_939030 [compost metagenome]